jgi:hypothetical protein
MRNAVLELTNLTKKIILDSNVRAELGLLTHNNFYNDFYVTLNDLLNLSSYVYEFLSDEIGNSKGSFLEAYSIKNRIK